VTGRQRQEAGAGSRGRKQGQEAGQGQVEERKQEQGGWEKGGWEKGLRLCRLPCGKPPAFRPSIYLLRARLSLALDLEWS